MFKNAQARMLRMMTKLLMHLLVLHYNCFVGRAVSEVTETGHGFASPKTLSQP